MEFFVHWLIDFSGISTRLGLLYAFRLVNCVHSKRFQLHVRLKTFFEFLSFFFHGINLFGLSFKFFLFLDFTPKLFRFLYIQLVHPHTLFTDLLVEFSFVILKFPVLFALLDPVQVSFKSSLFCQYVLIYLF